MVRKTQSELDREIEVLENKYKDAIKKEESEKKIKDLRQKLIRHKYRKQLAIADNIKVSTAKGLRGLSKSLSQGFQKVVDYQRECERREKKAKRGKKK